MDNTTITALQKAQELLKAGNKQEARTILIPIIQADQNVAEAWYLLGFAVTDPEKRMSAFQQVLRVDPSNQAAQKQIAKLQAAAAPATETPVAPEKPAGSALAWVLAGGVALLLCLILAGGWWLSHNGLPVFQAPTPTKLSLHPTPRPTVTPYPRPTRAPTLTQTPTPAPSLTATLLVRANATADATPNLAAFAGILSAPIPGTTPNVSAFMGGPNWEWGNGQAGFTESKYGHLNAGETVSVPLEIDNTATETIFSLQWVGKDAPVFTLISPDHQLIDQDYVAKHPDEVTFWTVSFYAMTSYSFKKTRAGTWELNLKASESGDYKVFGLLTTGLIINVGSDKYSYTGGDTATFAARLKDKSVGVSGATISIILGFSDRTTETLSMKDYGDGIYATTYTIPDVAGFVSAEVTAKGSNRSTTFTRQTPFLFTITPNDIQLTNDYSDKIGDIDKDGNKTLDIQIGINAGHSGKFTVSGQLISGNEVVSTTNTNVSLIPGHNVVTLKFWGKDIRHDRLDGPYKVNILPISDWQSGVYIDLKNNTWQTAAYHWRDFGSELCFSLSTKIEPVSAGSLLISPEPNCPNGQYLSTTLVTLKVIAKPGFRFKSWSGDMEGVDSSSPTITLRIQRNMVANAFFEKKP
jgi:hypothetical protein